MVARLHTQHETHVQRPQQLDVWPVRGQRILHHQQLQMGMLPPHVPQQPLRSVALAVVFLCPICAQNRLRRQRKHLPVFRMHQHRTQHLVVIRDGAVPAAFLATLRATYTCRGMIARAVHRQQVVVQPGEAHQPLTALQGREHALEGDLTQRCRVHLVQPFAHRCVRRCPRHPVQVPQVRPNALLTPYVPVETQQRHILQPEHRQRRHQTV